MMAWEAQRTRIWDLPTRVFHWALVLLLPFSWWSAKSNHLDWHRVSGICLLGLLGFRLIWGFCGASTARFTQFIKGPGSVWRYVREGAADSPVPGHTPLGGWSVLALLLLMALQVLSGLFAVDVDGIESGPLSYLVDFDRGRAAAHLHHTAFNLLLVLIFLHLAAILIYRAALGRNLVGAMITGSRIEAALGALEPVRPAPLWRLFGAAAAAALLALGAAKGFRI